MQRLIIAREGKFDFPGDKEFTMSKVEISANKGDPWHYNFHQGAACYHLTWQAPFSMALITYDLPEDVAYTVSFKIYTQS